MGNRSIFSVNLSLSGASLLDVLLGTTTIAWIFTVKPDKPLGLAFGESPYCSEGRRRARALAWLGSPLLAAVFHEEHPHCKLKALLRKSLLYGVSLT